MDKFSHEPVLLKEVLTAFDYLRDKGNAVFVDGTVGLAGHSLAIAKQSQGQDCHSGLDPESQDSCFCRNDNFKIIGIDRDEEALRIAKLRTTDYGLQTNFIFVHDDFHNIDEILRSAQNDGLIKTDMIDGMLLDLGVSSMQLDDKGRGFSFEDPAAPLDMRMDQKQIKSAKDILNNYSISGLEEVLVRGEEKHYKKIARTIAETRKEKPFRTVGDLLTVLEKIIPKKSVGKNFATDTFRALRLEVNDELAPLARTIGDIVPHLRRGGRLAIITFHSLEDRIVKQTFKKLENPCTCPPEFPYCTCGNKPLVKIVSKKAIEPSSDEISENPRSRSAKLRVVEKI